MSELSPTPKVSILIPVYNVEKYVERCILSVLRQTMQKGVEVIILNDCTPDQSMEIIRNVLQTHFKESKMAIHIIEHERNQGIATARNTLINHAKGKYVWYIDSDDYVDSKMLEKMYDKAMETGADIVMTDVLKEYPAERKIIVAPYYPRKEEVLKRFIRGDNNYLWNKLIRRSLYFEHKITTMAGMDMSEDYGVLVSLCYAANKVEYVSGVFYHYIQYNTLSLTKRKVRQKEIDSWLFYTEKIGRFLKEQGMEGYDLDYAYYRLCTKIRCMKSVTGKMQQEYGRLFPEITSHKWELLCLFPGRTYKILVFLALFGYSYLFNFLLKTASFLGKKY